MQKRVRPNFQKLLESIVLSVLNEQGAPKTSTVDSKPAGSSALPAVSSAPTPSATADTSGSAITATQEQEVGSPGDSGLEGSELGSADIGSGGGAEGGDMSLGDGEEAIDDDGSSSMGGFGGGGGGGFPSGGGGGGFGGGSDGGSSMDDEDSSKEDSSGITPEGEPKKDPNDPVGAALEEAEKVAAQTTDAQKILNAIKASIQVNFSDYREAWPLVDRLKQTENKTLQAVASRLALFIADILQESNAVNKLGTIIRHKDFAIRRIRRRVPGFREPQLQYDVSVSPGLTSWYKDVGFGTYKGAIEFAKQLLRNKADITMESKTVKITEQQLRNLVREAVREKLMAESTNYVEQERMRQEVNMLALEFLEKLTQKLSIDPATLSPEALEVYRRTHKSLESSVRMAASELFQLGTVLQAAQGSNSSGDKSGST